MWLVLFLCVEDCSFFHLIMAISNYTMSKLLNKLTENRMRKYLFNVDFQTGQENTPVLTAVCGSHLDSTKHLLKQCSVRLERLPLKLTTDNDFQSYESISEKQSSDCTAGKHCQHGLGDNLLFENSTVLLGESEDRNGKLLKNNYYGKVEGNLVRPIQANHGLDNLCNQKIDKSAHTVERHYKCSDCDYSATRKHNLKLHVQAKHTLEKPFQCNECDYSTVHAGNLKLHVQAKHTLEKPFHCNECDFSTVKACNLKVHVQAKHTLERPIQCNECDFTTVRAGSLKRHVQAKHTLEKPFYCNECDYSTVHAGNLKLHVQAKHTLERPYHCNECDYSTVHASNLNRHIKAKHTLEKPSSVMSNYSAATSSLKRHV